MGWSSRRERETEWSLLLWLKSIMERVTTTGPHKFLCQCINEKTRSSRDDYSTDVQSFINRYPTRPQLGHSNTRPNTVLGVFGRIWAHIWARQIWSSGVSLKRSCKMQFSCVGLRSIGPSSQKLRPNEIFGRFPHCNNYVKLKIGVRMSFMGL